MTDTRREYAQQEAEAWYEALHGLPEFDLDGDRLALEEALRCQTHRGGRFEGHYADAVCGCFGEDEGDPEPVCSEVVEGFQPVADPCRFEKDPGGGW